MDGMRRGLPRRDGLIVLAFWTAFLSLPLMASKCSENECDKLSVAVAAACMAEPTSEVCKSLTQEYGAKCSAQPTPTTPPPPTTTLPEPPPTTTTTTTTTLPQQPPVSVCPPLDPGAEVYINSKPYGNGWDSTIRVRHAPKFCEFIHGVQTSDCHLEGLANRSACERELAGGCPVWQYEVGAGWKPCLQPDGEFSCSHFGDPAHRDDPMTPAFEGEPKECGLQRDRDGNPMAGYFVIAHGKGLLRACLPGYATCSGSHAVNY
jgi:hypothetical protein